MILSLNMSKLKDSIMSVIKDNEYTMEDLKDILGPVYELSESTVFMVHLNEVVEEILRDRDGNGKFNSDDLDLLNEDVLGVMSLVNGVLLVLNSVPQLRLKYESDLTEELIFKLFAYIFLIIVPKETGNPWNEKEKEKMVDLSLSIYMITNSTKFVKESFEKIEKWFVKSGLCKCLSSPLDKEEVFNEKIPQVKAEIRSVVQREKHTAKLKREISNLQDTVSKLSSVQVSNDNDQPKPKSIVSSPETTDELKIRITSSETIKVSPEMVKLDTNDELSVENL